MVKQYVVRDQNDEYGFYLEEKSAQHHFEAIQSNPELCSDSLFIEEREISKISGQRVVIEGGIAGFQFSKSRNGKRTLPRTVRNLCLRDGKLTGEILFNWSRYGVVHTYLDRWVLSDSTRSQTR